MAVPVGIVTRLRDLGAHSSFVFGENILKC